jgi:D-3-phosphoglycerate dehydrogenase
MHNILISTSTFDLNNLINQKFYKDGRFNFILNPYKRKLTEIEIKSLLVENEIVGLIAGLEPLTREVLLNAKNLKVISRCGTGVDNVDIVATNALEILLYNTPDATIAPVAELTLGHILNILRNITESDHNIRNNMWRPKIGSLLQKKTVGILGFGRIGQKVADLVKSFGANVIYYDPFCEIETIFKKVDFDFLIENSDIITLHLPLNNDTKDIINKDVFIKMKKNCILINIARGGLVNENDLYTALSNNQIQGAGLDVYDLEPYIGPLKGLKNILLTSHIGSFAIESRELMEIEAANNLFSGLEKFNIL